MKTTLFTVLSIIALFALDGCKYEKLPEVDSELLDPNGGFTLYVSNQSFAISPVDILVEIDGELVVSGYFKVGDQHDYKGFTLALLPGEHNIRIWSKKGETEFSKEFVLKGEYVGIITYWYYPKSKSNPLPRHFKFKVQSGPLMII